MSKSPFHYFKAIYCINLDTRTDRWEQAIQEFKKVKILNRVQRFPGIVGGSCGAHNCLLSHLTILQEAKRKKLENVLILEDDVEFYNLDLLPTLEKAILELPEYSLFYLGILGGKFKAYSENLFRLQENCCGTHAICYHQRIYDEILEFYGQGKNPWDECYPIDRYLADLVQFREKGTYCTNPAIALQRNSRSDVCDGPGRQNMRDVTLLAYNEDAARAGIKPLAL